MIPPKLIATWKGETLGRKRRKQIWCLKRFQAYVTFYPLIIPDPKTRKTERIDFLDIAPAWPPRFADMDFRAFVEKTLRQETPAHIMPRVCWVDKDQMGRFEKAYQDWVEANADDRGVALNQLVRELAALRSVYPEARLTSYTEEGVGTNPLLLDRTHLGSEG